MGVQENLVYYHHNTGERGPLSGSVLRAAASDISPLMFHELLHNLSVLWL